MESTAPMGGQTEWSMSQEAMRRIFTRRFKRFLVFAAVLLAGFSPGLVKWARHGIDDDVFSYILLIPIIVAYLIWTQRNTIPLRISNKPKWGLIAFGIGTISLALYGASTGRGWVLSGNDQVVLISFAFVLFVLGGMILFFGPGIPRALAFPFGFLFFMVPLPDVVTHGLEVFFQYTSAEASYLLLKISGTPVFRHGLVFQIPGIVLEVAQECSGIRSSLVLFISSVLAGHIMLKSRWRMAVLTLFVIPLAIARNALRILTIALLCVHVSPEMIHSPVHKNGGPYFFALSLIPFFVVLYFLRRSERPPPKKQE